LEETQAHLDYLFERFADLCARWRLLFTSKITYARHD